MLGVVASVCTPLPTRTQKLPTLQAQQRWELLRPFARNLKVATFFQDSPYFILNIYAPNKCSEQFLFSKDLSDILKGARAEQDHPFIVGRDFNVILDHVIDGQGGNSKRKDSRKIIDVR